MFFLRRVQRPNAFEHFAHHGRFRRVGKTLAVVPLRQCRQPQLQGIDRQHTRMLDQIPRNAVGCGRQKPTPRYFEMLDGGAIAAAGVVTGGGLQVAIQIAHGLFSRWRTDSRMSETHFAA
ncbi:MAG: hypothetical protein RSB64_15370 [Pseudomonas sp.]